jgi:hypothetical protein
MGGRYELRYEAEKQSPYDNPWNTLYTHSLFQLVKIYFQLKLKGKVIYLKITFN